MIEWAAQTFSVFAVLAFVGLGMTLLAAIFIATGVRSDRAVKVAGSVGKAGLSVAIFAGLVAVGCLVLALGALAIAAFMAVAP